jgi:hypothetical protein
VATLNIRETVGLGQRTAVKARGVKKWGVVVHRQKWKTAWHKAAESGQLEVLEKLWSWIKNLQLGPEDLRNEVLFSKDKYNETT